MIRNCLVPLFVFVPLLAQGTARTFQADLHWVAPTFEGHLEGIESGQKLVVNLQDDLGLGKDNTKVGIGLEYQGPRFGLEFSMDSQNYKGSKLLTRTISVDGHEYTAGTQVDSELKVAALNLNWTIRVLTGESAWLGVDLGARSWALDFTTTSAVYQATEKFTVPIPQVGCSAGFRTVDGKWSMRGYYHLLTQKGASYHHTGADARYFPLPWLGVRAFLVNESLDIPKGSIQDDLEVKLDRNGFGFGVVVRY